MTTPMREDLVEVHGFFESLYQYALASHKDPFRLQGGNNIIALLDGMAVNFPLPAANNQSPEQKTRFQFSIIIHKTCYIKLWDWIMDAYVALKLLETQKWNHEKVTDGEFDRQLFHLKECLMKVAEQLYNQDYDEFFHEYQGSAHERMKKVDKPAQRPDRGNYSYFGRTSDDNYLTLGLMGSLKYVDNPIDEWREQFRKKILKKFEEVDAPWDLKSCYHNREEFTIFRADPDLAMDGKMNVLDPEKRTTRERVKVDYAKAEKETPYEPFFADDEQTPSTPAGSGNGHYDVQGSGDHNTNHNAAVGMIGRHIVTRGKGFGFGSHLQGSHNNTIVPSGSQNMGQLDGSGSSAERRNSNSSFGMLGRHRIGGYRGSGVREYRGDRNNTTRMGASRIVGPRAGPRPISDHRNRGRGARGRPSLRGRPSSNNRSANAGRELFPDNHQRSESQVQAPEEDAEMVD